MICILHSETFKHCTRKHKYIRSVNSSVKSGNILFLIRIFPIEISMNKKGETVIWNDF